MRRAWLLLVLALGCSRAPKRAAPEAEAPPLAPSPPAALPPLPFEEARAPRVGLPQGCALVERRVARVGAPRALFFASDDRRDELVVALPGDPPRAGVVGLLDGKSRRLLQFEMESPPLFAATNKGWLSLFTRPGAAGSRVVLWREGSEPEVALEGDGAEAVDLRCRGGRCAALSTRAARVATAGATVLVGDLATPAKAWARADYTPEGAQPERPFVVADPGDPVVATTVSEKSVQFFRVKGAEAAPGPAVEAPFGALDAIALRRAVVLGHGAQRKGDCAEPKPLLSIFRDGAPRIDLPADAPVLSLFVRPIAGGAMAAWLVPTHCGDRLRRVVYAALLDEEGAPRSSPMAVADATGVALATEGDRAELWLLQGEQIVWIRARCAP